MSTKEIKKEEICLRKFSEKDIERAGDFLDLNNCMAEEDLMLTINKKRTLEEEKKILKGKLKRINNQEEVFLFAEEKNLIVGTFSVKLYPGAQDHVTEGSALKIRKEYRRMGVGKSLIKEAVDAVKNDLRKVPKFFKIKVFSNNEPAIKLYEKMGFKFAVSIPQQVRYKGEFVDEVIMLKNIS